MHELAVLQNPQNLSLRLYSHGCDFIQEQRSLICNFKETLLRRDRTGESTLDVSEQRGLKQICRRGPGVYRYEWPVTPRRIQVHGLGNDFLASSALPLQQHRRATGCHLRDQVENLQHGLALAHDVFKVVALLQGPLELNAFFFGSEQANCGSQAFPQLFAFSTL